MPDNSPFNVRRSTKITDLAEKDQPRASNNLPEGKIISMTFNMPEEWHRRFKMMAVAKGMNMKELFEECLHFYVKSHNGK